jgi:hypothetical protein
MERCCREQIQYPSQRKVTTCYDSGARVSSIIGENSVNGTTSYVESASYKPTRTDLFLSNGAITETTTLSADRLQPKSVTVTAAHGLLTINYGYCAIRNLLILQGGSCERDNLRRNETDRDEWQQCEVSGEPKTR